MARRRCAGSRAFFALPLTAKQAVTAVDKGNTRGYGGVASQALDEGQPGDLKETFQAGPEPAAVRPNAWPADLPGFREAVMAFHTTATAACNQLMDAIALALGLPQADFKPFHTHSDSTARLLHYPPLQAAPAPGQLRAHTY